MKTLYEYREIFDEFSLEENEYLVKIFQGDYTTDYPFGFLFGKLTEKDGRFLKLIENIKDKKINDNDFQKFIVNLKKSQHEKERKLLVQKIKECESMDVRDYMSAHRIEFIDVYLNEITFSKIIYCYKSTYDSLNGETNIFNCTADDYVSYSIIKLLYEYYNHSLKRFSVPENNKLEKFYLNFKIDIVKNDCQYNKFQLLTIDENFDISNGNITKVYDNRVNTHILINEVSCDLLQYFKKLRMNGFIKYLALRPEYNVVGSDFIDLSIALEELEQGEIFSLQNLGKPLVSKLYTKEYDNLWIVIDQSNITFEEVLQDFKIFDEFIVTQVVHL